MLPPITRSISDSSDDLTPEDLDVYPLSLSDPFFPRGPMDAEEPIESETIRIGNLMIRRRDPHPETIKRVQEWVKGLPVPGEKTDKKKRNISTMHLIAAALTPIAVAGFAIGMWLGGYTGIGLTLGSLFCGFAALSAETIALKMRMALIAKG